MELMKYGKDFKFLEDFEQRKGRCGLDLLLNEKSK